jgi:hypothetical protein
MPWDVDTTLTDYMCSRDSVLDNDATRYQQKYGTAANNKHKEVNQAVLIEHGKSEKPLKPVKPGDVLIIASHGSPVKGQRKEIYMKCRHWMGSNYLFTVSKNDLADQLRDDGLDPQHRVIKLLACYGGGIGWYKEEERKTYHDNDTCLAQSLAKALGKRNFHNILVGGYVGSYNLNQKNQFGINAPVTTVYDYKDYAGKEHQLKANDQLRWFNAGGQEVTRPKVATPTNN